MATLEAANLSYYDQSGQALKKLNKPVFPAPLSPVIRIH